MGLVVIFLWETRNNFHLFCLTAIGETECLVWILPNAERGSPAQLWLWWRAEPQSTLHSSEPPVAPASVSHCFKKGKWNVAWVESFWQQLQDWKPVFFRNVWLLPLNKINKWFEVRTIERLLPFLITLEIYASRAVWIRSTHTCSLIVSILVRAIMQPLVVSL